MNLKAYPPGDKLKSIIKRHCIYEVQFDKDQFQIQPILPLVVPTLEFLYGDQFKTVRYSDGQAEKVPYHGVLGPITQRKIYLEMTGNIGVLCTEFYPAAFYSVFKVPMHELTDLSVEGDVVLGKEINEISARILEAESDYERIVLVEKFVSSHLEAATKPSVVDAALTEMHRYKGLCSVHLLSKHLTISERHLENSFKKQVGVTPKLYNRILRFNRIFALLQNGARGKSWQDIMHECGYYDQSHFIRDFKFFTGTTPARYFAKPTDFENFFLGS